MSSVSFKSLNLAPVRRKPGRKPALPPAPVRKVSPLEVWADQAKAAAATAQEPPSISFPFETMAVGDQFVYPSTQLESVQALAELYSRKLKRMFKLRPGWVCRRIA